MIRVSLTPQDRMILDGNQRLLDLPRDGFITQISVRLQGEKLVDNLSELLRDSDLAVLADSYRFEIIKDGRIQSSVAYYYVFGDDTVFLVYHPGQDRGCSFDCTTMIAACFFAKCQLLYRFGSVKNVVADVDVKARWGKDA